MENNIAINDGKDNFVKKTMQPNEDYGNCKYCGTQLKPVRFREDEYKIEGKMMYKTGRNRLAVDFLICEKCLRHYCADDTFDGPWRNK